MAPPLPLPPPATAFATPPCGLRPASATRPAPATAAATAATAAARPGRLTIAPRRRWPALPRQAAAAVPVAGSSAAPSRRVVCAAEGGAAEPAPRAGGDAAVPSVAGAEEQTAAAPAASVPADVDSAGGGGSSSSGGTSGSGSSPPLTPPSPPRWVSSAPASTRTPPLPPPAHPSVPRERLSWADVEGLVGNLAAQVAASPTPADVVVAITRGGMIPATLLCERLGKRTLVSATVMLYTDEGQKFYGLDGPRFLNFPDDEALTGRHVLVVDDVWDSGVTALSVAGRCGRSGAASVSVAVLHFKPERGAAAGAPDFFAQTTESWVVYPWEPVPE